MKAIARTCAWLIIFMLLAAEAWEQAPQLAVQTGHFDVIVSIAYSADGKILASGDYDGWIVIWRTDKGDQVRSWKAHESRITSLVFVANDSVLISASRDGTVRVWDPNKEGTMIGGPFVAHEGNSVDSLAFSSRRNILASASNSPEDSPSVKLWDFSNRALINPRIVGNEAKGVSSIAFSPDGNQFVTGGHDHIVKLWDISNLLDTESLIPNDAFNYRTEISSVAFSPDGKWIAAAGGGGNVIVVVWNHRSHQPLSLGESVLFQTQDEWISSLAFSPDGQWLAAGTDTPGKALHLWELNTSNEMLLSTEQPVPSHPKNVGVRALAFSSDGSKFASGGSDQTITTRNPKNWDEQPHIFHHHVRRITALTLSTNGVLLATAGRVKDFNQGDIRIWDLSGQNEPRKLSGDYPVVVALAFSPTSNLLVSAHLAADRAVRDLAGAHDAEIRFWDLTSGEQLDPTIKLRRIAEGLGYPVGCLAFSHDGQFLASGGDDGTIRVWHVIQGINPLLEADILVELPILQGNVRRDAVRSLVFSSENVLAIASRSDSRIHLWNFNNGRRQPNELPPLETEKGTAAWVQSLAFSPESNLLASGTTDGEVQIWDFKTHNRTLKTRFSLMNGPGTNSADHAINSLVFLPGGKKVISGSADHGINIWDVDSDGKQLLRYVAKDTGQPVNALAAGKDVIWSSNLDPQVRLWHIPQEGGPPQEEPSASNEHFLLGRLVPLDDTDWIVIDPIGQFDSTNLEEITDLRWVFPDQPLQPLPPEIFMRDYYEPRLLSRLLGDKPSLPPLRSVAELNRNQPLVEKITVIPQPGRPDLVTIKVEVSSTAGQCLRDKTYMPCESGVFDLRLYRDAQLVGEIPAPGIVPGKEGTPTDPQQELKQWRQLSLLKDDQLQSITVASGKRTISFHDISLPQRMSVSSVQFTAYAFNEDRVKSATSLPVKYVLPPQRLPIQRHAYIITMGVGVTSSDLHLAFAPVGALAVGKLLEEKLGSKYHTVWVPLISSRAQGDVLEDNATRANLELVLEILSGQASPSQREQFPQLNKTTPDDLVAIYIASHGYADPQGKFYVIPSDVGLPMGTAEPVLNRCSNNAEHSLECDHARAFLGHSISSSELTQWLQRVDAGEMVLILDSCHSAAVTGSNFKPGPMGDRGFGQLAYDKRMLVLAATQSDSVAWGTLGLGDRSLLTEALLVGQEIKDPTWNLKQWLKQGEHLVPQLYNRYLSAEKEPQYPALFDFAKVRLPH